jgi:hypothetical protein
MLKSKLPSGFIEMEGVYEPESPNYGNYKHKGDRKYTRIYTGILLPGGSYW